jgi:hypothetical protein
LSDKKLNQICFGSKVDNKKMANSYLYANDKHSIFSYIHYNLESQQTQINQLKKNNSTHPYFTKKSPKFCQSIVDSTTSQLLEDSFYDFSVLALPISKEIIDKQQNIIKNCYNDLHQLERDYAITRAKNYINNDNIQFGYPGTYWISTSSVPTKMSIKTYLDGVLNQIISKAGQDSNGVFRDFNETYVNSEYTILHEQYPTLDIIRVCYEEIAKHMDTNTTYHRMNDRLFIAIPENIEGNVDEPHYIYDAVEKVVSISHSNIKHTWLFMSAMYVFSTKPDDKYIGQVNYLLDTDTYILT